MKQVFADSLYWIALAHPHDQWHSQALAAERQLKGITLVTTEEVLTELLAALSAFGPQLRTQAVKIVRAILQDDCGLLVHQSHETFEMGLERYERRTDKGYSLTDCVSMNTCRQMGIQDVLTNDRHFVQEGFRVLIA